MSRFKRGRLLFVGLLLAVVAPAACGSSGVVGGNCASGYSVCDGRCVDLQRDPLNCNGCGLACDLEEGCRKGVCTSNTEGDAGEGAGGGAGESGAKSDSGANGMSGGNGGDSGTNGNAGNAGNAGNSSNGGSSGNSGFGGASGTLGDGGDQNQGGANGCAPPYDSPAACGDCMTQCVAPSRLCAPDAMGSYKCVPACVLPLQECNGQCVDFNIDANNCGSCGHVCPSGICQGGMCVGANVGHVVLACMNYQTPANNTPQTALMGNAVLLPLRNPVRILAYTQYASAGSRAKVDQDIGLAAAARGRTYTIKPLANFMTATASLDIAAYDVFLIYDQNVAPPGQMATVGAAWQTSLVLDSFTRAGGIVIGLSGGATEMDQFFSASSLLDVSAQTSVTGAMLYNRAPADAMGTNVISPFLAPVDSCTFTTSVVPDADTIFVVRDEPGPAAGKPVVVHRVIEP